MSNADIFTATGKINPFYLPASAPSDIVTSPFTVNSIDDTRSVVISVPGSGGGVAPSEISSSNNEIDFNLGVGNAATEGLLAISNNGSGDITLAASSGGLVISSNAYGIELEPYNSVVTVLGTVNASGIVFESSNCEVTYGTTDLELVSGAGVFTTSNKAGRTGTVYDSQFNPVASINSATYTSASTISASTLSSTVGALGSGLYMLQAKVLIDNATIPYSPGTNLNVYLEDFPPTPATYLPWSAINITAGMLSTPSGAEGTNIDCTFTSAVFSVPAGKTNWTYFIEAVGNWDFGSGNLKLQLVKIG